MRFFVFFTLIFSLNCFSQTYPNRLQGTFNLPNIDTLNAQYPSPISFTLEWSETGKEMNGRYQDNFLSGSTPVLGVNGPAGRMFTVVFPQAVQGIKSLEINTSENATSGRPVAINVTSKNEAGGAIAVMNILGTMSSSVTDSTCSLGFGVLAGYCGHYSGLTQETSDSANLCQLAQMKGLVLEVLPSTEVSVIANDVPTSVGSLPLSPLSNRVQLNSRNCGAMLNTGFDPTHCLAFSLQGEFFPVGNTRTFTGSYSVRDETSGETCTYFLNVEAKMP